jgi:UDP-N-acetylglucosamine transferase subunit ALG13
MIFVTLGTHEQPFARALDAVGQLAGTDELVIQHGSTPPRSDLFAAEWVDYLQSDALLATIRRAGAVICHAGVGSILTAVRNQKTPVVLPRLSRFGEHVDDHQLELAERFAERGLIVVCHPEDGIATLVSRAKTMRPGTSGGANARLCEAVAAAVREQRAQHHSVHRLPHPHLRLHR